MRLCYDGTHYGGWQVQPNCVSIQGTIEEALRTLLRQPIRVVGAGRTDAGVHALSQTAHFSCESFLDSGQILNALNGMLPHDIRVKELEPTLDTFHAQYSALFKEYHYHLWLEKIILPFHRLYRHRCYSKDFSLSLLKEGASCFIGTHDFATFANVGGAVKSTVRTIMRIDCVEQEGGVRLEFEGNGFLYKMVRNIVGTLLEVATLKRALSDIPALLAKKDRRSAGPAAPPRGLFLANVFYPARFLNNAGNEEACVNTLPTSSESCLISEASK